MLRLFLLVVHCILSTILVLVAASMNASSWRGLVNHVVRDLLIALELWHHLLRTVRELIGDLFGVFLSAVIVDLDGVGIEVTNAHFFNQPQDQWLRLIILGFGEGTLVHHLVPCLWEILM
jgi:hypothetical protein